MKTVSPSPVPSSSASSNVHVSGEAAGVVCPWGDAVGPLPGGVPVAHAVSSISAAMASAPTRKARRSRWFTERESKDVNGDLIKIQPPCTVFPILQCLSGHEGDHAFSLGCFL